jgi:glycosyltransferase involved in cell wall biosynthesis
MKRLLMIAYHFPPLVGSSGLQRTLRFAQHLRGFGWSPLVLTATETAYEQTSQELMRDVPPEAVVRRARAWDAARHMAWRGRYFSALARPDRWVSWRFDAVRQGMKIVREFRPQALWSTYPIATAHLIGAELHRRTALPWVADFRDPMAQDGYPEDERVWRSYAAIEARALQSAAYAVFTTPSAAATYRARYPPAAERVRVIENGYDEESFVQAEQVCDSAPLNAGQITLLHSGIVYPKERDPTALFAALGRLHRDHTEWAACFKVRFRAPVHEAMLRDLARVHGIESLVEVLPAVGYRAALQEMLRADALLAMQGSNCNEQVPAKVYEYLRARRPILALADPLGDTAKVLSKAGVADFATLESVDAISRVLPAFVERVRERTAQTPPDAAVVAASRRDRTQELVRLLEECTAADQTELRGPT